MTSLGEQGERLAEEFLKKKGFVSIARRFKNKRWGEIDLIMRDGDTTAFIEVKTRSDSGGLFGGPLGAINRSKIEALKRTAQFYMTSQGFNWEAARIDAVTVVFQPGGTAEIKHYTDITTALS